ncbi:unnamed protein product [Sphagnum tenellum]
MLPWPSMDMKSSLHFEADQGQPQTSRKLEWHQKDSDANHFSPCMRDGDSPLHYAAQGDTASSSIRQGSKKSAGIQPDYTQPGGLPVSANTQPGGTEAALPSKLLNHIATWCQAVTVDDQSKRAL